MCWRDTKGTGAVSEILQNIDAVLGITMSVLAMLGFGHLIGRSRPPLVTEAATAPAARQRKSGFGKVVWVVLLVGMIGVGGYMSSKWFDGRGYSRGGYDHWRGADRGSRDRLRGYNHRRR